MREVSDSIHLRRFCQIGMTERVPDESTVRKLTRRLGAEVVHEITRELIQKARREKRLQPRAARIDSTVVEADVRWPTDAGLAADGTTAPVTSTASSDCASTWHSSAGIWRRGSATAGSTATSARGRSHPTTRRC